MTLYFNYHYPKPLIKHSTVLVCCCMWNSFLAVHSFSILYSTFIEKDSTYKSQTQLFALCNCYFLFNYQFSSQNGNILFCSYTNRMLLSEYELSGLRCASNAWKGWISIYHEILMPQQTLYLWLHLWSSALVIYSSKIRHMILTFFFLLVFLFVITM